MHRVVELFYPEVKRIGFLSEWALYVEEGMSAETLANVFMEQLRATDDGIRQAFTRLLGYMGPRSWTQFFESVKEILEPEEIERFKAPCAEEFYERLRMLCVLQVEEYWKQFFADKQKEAKEILGALDQLPTSLLRAKIEAAVRAEVTAQTDVALQKTVVALRSEIKKLLDDRNAGDSWKSGEGTEP